MNVVVPMAGAGSRFARAGFALPKPLIPVRGEPMYRWAVSSLDLRQCTRLIFVLRATEWSDRLRDDIRSTFGAHDPQILIVDHLTRGQAETVYLTAELIDPHRPVLIHNSDTAFVSRPGTWSFDEDDGVLLTFTSDEERWSYARRGPKGLVDLVAEKVVISNHASTGAYFFRDTQDLFRRLERLVARPATSEELYIAPIYNELITEGRRVTLREVDANLCFGTPADLDATLGLIERRGIRRQTLVASDAG